MSNLTDKTEYSALRIIAKLVTQFERLHFLDMSKEDDWDACHARNLLTGIVESNGYSINYKDGSNRPLIKNGNHGKNK